MSELHALKLGDVRTLLCSMGTGQQLHQRDIMTQYTNPDIMIQNDQPIL